MEPFSDHSDEFLCGLAASGDRAAEECLALRYSRVVRMCARPYFLAGGDSEDLIQEGMIGLLSAIRSFQPDRDALFRSYAEICIRNRLLSAVRSAARDKHSPLNHSLSIQASVFDGSSFDAHISPAVGPEDLLISREERTNQIKHLRGKLSKLEDQILDLYLDGLAYTEIAARLGKPLKSVDNAVQRIRRKAAPLLNSGDISES